MNTSLPVLIITLAIIGGFIISGLQDIYSQEHEPISEEEAKASSDAEEDSEYVSEPKAISEQPEQSEEEFCEADDKKLMSETVSEMCDKIPTSYDYVRNFIESIAETAMVCEREYGIIASVNIAQACMESGYGRSDLAITGNNIFGIRASSSWTGKVVVYNGYSCRKYDSWSVAKYIDGIKYRAYDTVEDCFADRCRILTTAERYKNVTNKISPRGQISEICLSGWGGGNEYIDLICIMITNYNLRMFDLER